MQLYDCTSYQIKPSFKGETKITMKTIFTQSIKKSNIFTTFCSLSVQWRKENFPEFKPIFQKCSFVGKNQILLFFELQKFSCFFVQIYISDAWTLKSFFFFFLRKHRKLLKVPKFLHESQRSFLFFWAKKVSEIGVQKDYDFSGKICF